MEKAAELFAQEAERLELLEKHPQIPELFAYFTVDSRQPKKFYPVSCFHFAKL